MQLDFYIKFQKQYSNHFNKKIVTDFYFSTHQYDILTWLTHKMF